LEKIEMDSVVETSDPLANIKIDPLDELLYGVVNIGRGAGLIKSNPPQESEIKKTYHALHRGYLDADKFGGTYVSTLRRLTRSARFDPEAAAKTKQRRLNAERPGARPGLLHSPKGRKSID
jgi:hypothetical protein